MFASIASANFDAVAFLRLGRTDQAVSLLKLGMSQVSLVVEDDNNELLENGQEMKSEVWPIGIISENHLHSGNGCNSNAKQFEDLFTKAFILSPDQRHHLVGTNHITERMSVELTCTLIYNLALTLHVEGIRTGSPNLLVKACDLYLKTYRILIGCDLEPTDPLVSVLLATSANLAAASLDLFYIPHSHYWRNTFVLVYRWATARNHHQREEIPMSTHVLAHDNSEDARFFALTAVLFQNTELMSTAPAA